MAAPRSLFSGSVTPKFSHISPGAAPHHRAEITTNQPCTRWPFGVPECHYKRLEAHGWAIRRQGKPGIPEPFLATPSRPLLDQSASPTTLVTLGRSGVFRGPQPAGFRVRGSHMMKKIQVAAAVALALSSVSFAQQAVQWKVSDGGNGHWYRFTTATYPSWNAARFAAEGDGAHLATINSQEEWGFVLKRGIDCYIGGFQDPTSPTWSEPAGGWRWVTGEPWSLGPWAGFSPDDAPCFVTAGDGTQDAAWISPGGIIDDIEMAPVPYCLFSLSKPAVFEWSADCNGDGIVDYGQCRDGSLPDYNGNNIPDCCESGNPCVVGNYPVQWRVADDGNGHWYQWERRSEGLSWFAAHSATMQAGGHLATIHSAAENQFVFSLTLPTSAWQSRFGPWLGGYQTSGSSEPGEGWRWVTNEPWEWLGWWPGEPNNGSCVGPEDSMHFIDYEARWNDLPGDTGFSSSCDSPNWSFISEWSADCNNDGIVDKGQILQGQLPDINNNGIPDPCEQPTCRNADLLADRNVNGTDLGILLAQWGPNTQYTISDINSDGVVDGSDLGLLLSFWGPCPY